MRKTFVLEDLDCANCAAKIENEIARLEGVTSCSVKIIRKLEPDVTMRV